MGNQRWKCIVLVLVFLIGWTFCLEVAQTEPSVPGVSHKPVTLSSLATFARRFWTTMASMAANDVRLKRGNNNNPVLNESVPTVVSPQNTNPDSTSLLSSELPDHSVELFVPRTTVTVDSNNDSVDVEFPKGTSRIPQPATSRRSRKHSNSRTIDPAFAPKLFTGHHQPSANEFHKLGNVEVFRPVASGTERNVPQMERITSGTPHRELSKTTACNETLSTQEKVEVATEASSVPWPPPPPHLLHDEFVAVIDHGLTSSVPDTTTTDADITRFASEVTPLSAPTASKASNTRKPTSIEFTGKPRSMPSSTGSKRTSPIRELTTEPTIFTENLATTESVVRLSSAATTAAVATTTTTAAVATTTAATAAATAATTTTTAATTTTVATESPVTSSSSLAAETTPGSSKFTSAVLTTNTAPDSEVSLLEIFDENIINNETLLASSMSKLSSLLTSSILSQESQEQPIKISIPVMANSPATVPTTRANDEFTSDFDFSSLLFSDVSSVADSTTTIAVPTTTSNDGNDDTLVSLDPTVPLMSEPLGHTTHDTLVSLDPTVPLMSEPLGHTTRDTLVSLDPTVPLMSEPLGHTTLDTDVVFLVPSNNLTSNKTTAQLVSTMQITDLDDGDEETSNDDDDDDDFELKEAGLTQNSKTHNLKKPNKFAQLIRLPVKNFTEAPGDCFFNISDQTKLCDWSANTQSSVQWSFGLGDTAFMSGGPTVDSNGQTDGGYAFVDTSSGLQGPTSEIQRASFDSPLLSKTLPHGRCFTFWYNIGGLSADRLRVLLVPEEQFQQNTQLLSRMPAFTVLWERKDTTNSTWMKGEILYTFSKEHRLIFEGFARSGSDPRRKFQGFVAVDDLAMDSDSCQAYCTFEGVLCDWENNEDGDDFDWELARGSDSHLTGPIRDHGDGPEGGFMFIDTAYPRRPGDLARLTSPLLAPTENGPICYRFWTHMYGNGIGTLRVVLLSSGEENVIWEVSGESGNSWHMGQVTVSSSTEFRLSMEGIVGKNALGRIAIDDVSFGPGPCPSSPQSALPLRGDCTFEADECGWVNAGSGDQYDWLRTSAGQPLLPGQGPNSGYRPPEPLSDHTTGLSSGFFLTMERSTIPPRSGDQAYIVGPTLQGTGANKCFSFWGYMHERSVDAAGPGLGSLRVYLRVGSSSILRPVWRLINYEHPDWFFAQAPISTEDKFQVVIGGTWGSTRQGAISVDDFTFYDGNCSVIPAEAEVIPGECTFDSNMCEWTSSVNRTKERTSWQLATNIRRPSNLDDHTYRASSGYVFFDIFSQQPHVVRLESPEIVARNDTLDDGDDGDDDAADDDDDESQRCLTFWFAPFGSSRNTFLRIIQKDVISNNETQVWEMTTANFQAFRPEWVYGQVGLNVNATHKLIFEGSSNNGGFALDDIMFVPGTCQSRPDSL